MKALAILIASLTMGCGSNGTPRFTATSPDVPPEDTGTVALSGGVTATAGVYALGTTESGDTWRFALFGAPFTFVVNVSGDALTTGTFTNTNSNIARGLAVDLDGGAVWMESFDVAAKGAERGDFALTITSTGPSELVDTATEWSSPHGSLSVTLPPGEGNASTADVSAIATF